MIIAIWDWLFTRRIWTVVEEFEVVAPRGGETRRIGTRKVLRDQFGNLKVFKDHI